MIHVYNANLPWRTGLPRKQKWTKKLMWVQLWTTSQQIQMCVLYWPYSNWKFLWNQQQPVHFFRFAYSQTRILQEDDADNEVMYSDIAHGNVNDDDDDDEAATALIEAEVCTYVMLMFLCTELFGQFQHDRLMKYWFLCLYVRALIICPKRILHWKWSQTKIHMLSLAIGRCREMENRTWTSETKIEGVNSFHFELGEVVAVGMQLVVLSLHKLCRPRLLILLWWMKRGPSVCGFCFVSLLAVTSKHWAC